MKEMDGDLTSFEREGQLVDNKTRRIDVSGDPARNPIELATRSTIRQGETANQALDKIRRLFLFAK